MASGKTADVVRLRIWKAQQLARSANIWIGYGKTSAWGNPDDPPDVTYGTTDIQELVALKKAEVVKLVVPDPSGTIEHAGTLWREVSIDNARSEGARCVYIATYLRYDEVPVVPFRQTGVYVDITRAEGVLPGKLVLLPGEIADHGYLLSVSNRTVLPRATDQKELIEALIEF